VKSYNPVMALPRRSLPPMAKVRQKLASDHVIDVRKDVQQKLRDSGLADKIKLVIGSRSRPEAAASELF